MFPLTPKHFWPFFSFFKQLSTSEQTVTLPWTWRTTLDFLYKSKTQNLRQINRKLKTHIRVHTKNNCETKVAPLYISSSKKSVDSSFLGQFYSEKLFETNTQKFGTWRALWRLNQAHRTTIHEQATILCLNFLCTPEKKPDFMTSPLRSPRQKWLFGR